MDDIFYYGVNIIYDPTFTELTCIQKICFSIITTIFFILGNIFMNRNFTCVKALQFNNNKLEAKCWPTKILKINNSTYTYSCLKFSNPSAVVKLTFFGDIFSDS